MPHSVRVGLGFPCVSSKAVAEVTADQPAVAFAAVACKAMQPCSLTCGRRGRAPPPSSAAQRAGATCGARQHQIRCLVAAIASIRPTHSVTHPRSRTPALTHAQRFSGGYYEKGAREQGEQALAPERPHYNAYTGYTTAIHSVLVCTQCVHMRTMYICMHSCMHVPESNTCTLPCIVCPGEHRDRRGGSRPANARHPSILKHREIDR